MKYLSTRDKTLRLSASQAIAQGLSRDGGLLTPETFPKLTPEFLEQLRGKSYAAAGGGGDEALPGGFLRRGADCLHPGRLRLPGEV